MFSSKNQKNDNKFSLILPVLFYEYLALSITKSIIPQILLKEFTSSTYLVVGLMETIKGLLAFISCPIFGRLSDHVGRKYCLLVTVIGSTLPVCLMALTPNIYLFVGTMAVSGIFSATFPLTFAYISDCVDKNKRAPAYGLALATFGLSFCIGPIAGSYLASQFGNWAVFVTSLVLVVLDVVYIVAFLPESVQAAKVTITLY
jgi:MFS family permease